MLVKSFTVKLIIVGFILMYLLSPLQTQLYKLLHQISHEVTNNHHHNAQTTKHKEETSHHHDFLNSTFQKKEHHHSTTKTDNHSHEWLAFLENTFRADNGTSQKNKLFLEVKLDKHTIPSFSSLSLNIPITNTSKKWFYHLNSDSLRLDTSTPPPKIIYT